MRRIHRIIRNVDLCKPGYPLPESQVVLSQESCKKIIQQISDGKCLGTFEPQIDNSLPSYMGIRPYDQAAFVVHSAWFIENTLRIAVEPMKTKAGWYFWNALKKGKVSFSPLVVGDLEPGTLRILPETFEYLCTDAFLRFDA